MLQQTIDLREEGDALFQLLDGLDEADWNRPTLFKAWTVNDIVQHLHDSDIRAAASLRDPDEYSALQAEIIARRDAGLTRVEEARQRFGDLTGRRLLSRWYETLQAVCSGLETRDPNDRLRWSGPDMGVRMFATARQMETWSHGQAIYDLKGVERENSDRIKNIAVIGVKTFGWAFRVHGQPVPDEPPYVRLTAPSGAVWEWNDPASESSVQGNAVDFCQVAAQVRNVADTGLVVSGETAEAWMAIAQCFAGPPETPPAPGLRLGKATA